ncbi:FMN-binding negative transcriptional regulator [Planktotalea sp.]|uniref:FMN-binding negative transcriptional regulator n=1 Tax=Planktotalea sp. TaxID=2029877 RepID=UPI0032979505
MHPNPIFRNADSAESLTFARARSFGTLAINGDPVPLFAHVPFLLNEDASIADLHLVRSNPIARALKNAPLAAKIAVTHSDSYISPDWYEIDDQVPTWNYIAVHFTGQLELQPQETLRALLDRQSAHFEQQLLPKTPWTTGKMTPDVLEKMMRAIVPVRLHIEDMQSSWKLGQNKPEEVRIAAAAQVTANGIGVETDALGAWMHRPPENT